MGTTRVVIVGGGVSGLLCSRVMGLYSTQVSVVESSKTLGGDFLAGGLKYVHHTKGMEELFGYLRVPCSSYTVRGGILLQGTILPYPRCFQDMDQIRADRIRRDHYRKTRGVEPGQDLQKSMNDPAGTQPRRALKCEVREFVAALAEGQTIVQGNVEKITSSEVLLADGERLPYDYLVVTLPLWVLRPMVDFAIPDALARRLNVIHVQCRQDPFARWDYVYTPYTPNDHIHRLSPEGGGYAAECAGKLNQANLVSDLNFLFPEGWALVKVRHDLKGHLLPLEQRVNWPPNVAPLGRFATWNPRATADVTLEKAKELAARWFGDKRSFGRNVEHPVQPTTVIWDGSAADDRDGTINGG